MTLESHLILAALPSLSHLFMPVTMIDQIQNTPMLILAALEFSLALAYFALWRAAPDYRAFLTMSAFFAAVALDRIWDYSGGDASEWATRAIPMAALIETAAEAMRVRNHRWTWLLWPIYFGAGIVGWYPSLAFVREWPIFASQAALAILIFQGLRHTNVRDRLNAFAFSAYFLVRFTLSPTFQSRTHIGEYLIVGGWRWQIPSVALIFLGGATLAIFVRDLIRDRREKLRLTVEVEAARIVQQVLIPEKIPNVPGFRIESIYRPFSEVGGDFVQIFPTPNGGVLIVIGDVSGKGMAAAMTVSLLVGTVRTLAHYTQSPGEILAAMNQRMLARNAGGFVTCLVVRADPDGALAIANAGHLPPYLNGEELPLENGLPLGLIADSAYKEETIPFDLEKQLTLVTDGVVEARNKKGDLYGFERLAASAGRSAEFIVEQAAKFGQEDDITVVTLARQKLKPAELASPADTLALNTNSVPA